MKELQKKNKKSAHHFLQRPLLSGKRRIVPEWKLRTYPQIAFPRDLVPFYLLKVQVLFRHVLGFRQITPSCLPTFSKAAKTLSNCSSVWVAM